MKLKSDFITQTIEDTQYMVSVAAQSFNGIVRSNETAAFIVDQLKKETSKEKIIDAMCREYDGERKTIEKDVEMILNRLREINALEE